MDWIATFLSIVGVVLNARRMILCWPVWILANILWIIHLVPKKEWALVFTWGVFTIANFYGWYQWRKNPLK